MDVTAIMRDTVNRVYDVLRDKIVRGEPSPGKRISQRKLARELNCSTIPISEAMRRLESEGLLVREPSRMVRVRTLSARDFRGLYLVREGLEGVAVRLCVEEITDDEISRLQSLGRELREATLDRDAERVGRLDAAIHRFIVHCSRCALLEEELNRLLLIEQTAGRKEASFHEPQSHEGLIQAIADREADLGEYLLRKHIQIGYQELLKSEDRR
jgi:DNA-binding GntR family transcriptional regulator